MSSFIRLCLLAVVAWPVVMFLGAGCGDDGTGPEERDTTFARIMVDSANDSLGAQLYSIIDTVMQEADSSFRPSDVDLTGVREIYQQALAADGSNLDAKFGVAFTGLLMFMADHEFNQVVEDFKELYDTLSFNPFRPADLLPAIDIGGGPAPVELPLKAARLPRVLPSPLALDRAVVSMALAVPTISRIQASLEARLLPALQEARVHLGDLISQSGYTFEITPAMQGNLGASPIIVDKSDFRVMLGATCAAEAGLRIFFARNLDIPEYTVAGAVEAASQGTAFLSLKGNNVGINHMATAKTLILQAEIELQAAVTSLEGEIGTDQTGHLIPVHPGDEGDLSDISDSLTHYRSYFGAQKEYHVVWYEWRQFWNGQYWEYEQVPDSESATVDIAKFFDAPMDNPKDFLPNYTVSGEAFEDHYLSIAAAHFSRDRYWAAMDTIFGLSYMSDTPYFDYHLPDTDGELFYSMLADYYAAEQFVFGWDDVRLQYTGCDPLSLWCYYSNWTWEYYDFYHAPRQVGVCFQWGAATWEEWTWPDATFNGLLPLMTTERIKEILQDREAGWIRTQCDTVSLEMDF